MARCKLGLLLPFAPSLPPLVALARMPSPPRSSVHGSMHLYDCPSWLWPEPAVLRSPFLCHSFMSTHSHTCQTNIDPLPTTMLSTQGMDAAKQRLLNRNYSEPSTGAAGATGALQLQSAGSLGPQPSTSGRANSSSLGVAPSGLAQVQHECVWEGMCA